MSEAYGRRPRKEDARLIRGLGKFIDDISLPGMLHAAILRSPLAHARIIDIDATAALAHPRVTTVLTGDDLAARGLAWMPTLSGDVQAVLATDKVRFQGQELAFVVATDRYAARDALELISVDAEPLTPVMDVGVATSGADFMDPPFPDNRAAIARDDSSGVGTGNPDSGEHHAAGRDLDHTNPDVRSAIKNYLLRLKSIGFQGWRYDLTKGYAGQFIGDYNDATSPAFSVGEFYDGDRQKVTSWIDATGGKTTAFDFPTRYLLYEACLSEDFGRLRSTNGGRVVPAGLLGLWPSRSVTFLDNHDTEYRRDYEHSCHNDGTRHFPGETVGIGYAYILTHPGTPCVFWPHFFDWGPSMRQRIERLIHLRRHCGIHSRSHVDIKEACRGLYAAIIDNKVEVKLGRRGWSPGGGWHLVVDGDKFAVWMRGN